METIFMHNESDMASHGVSRQSFVDFLHTHLGQFGDSKKAIDESITYAFTKSPGMGGFLSAAMENGTMVGALIMLNTGMADYVPENILLYVAVDASQRGKGVGRFLINESVAKCSGHVKLHVEYENPAKRLYERLGFASKYAEMRLVR